MVGPVDSPTAPHLAQSTVWCATARPHVYISRKCLPIALLFGYSLLHTRTHPTPTVWLYCHTVGVELRSKPPFGTIQWDFERETWYLLTTSRTILTSKVKIPRAFEVCTSTT